MAAGAGCRFAGLRVLHLQRVAWRWVQQNLRPDSQLVSGEELGRAFGRSARWGRYVKRAGHAGLLDEGACLLLTMLMLAHRADTLLY